MNDAQKTNPTSNVDDTFGSQPAQQTNPFTADLKSEFTSNFGTNTNAVSQIFQEGGFSGGNKNKNYIIAGVVVAILAAVFFFMTGEDSSEEFVDDEISAVEGEELAGDEESDFSEEGAVEGEEGAVEGEEEVVAEDEGAAVSEEGVAEAAPELAQESAVASEYSSEPALGSAAISLMEPADGSRINYDETVGAAVFSWDGGAANIVFSRNASMSPITFSTRANGSYSFHQPWPGNWYWQVKNAAGSSEVRSFEVAAPIRRNLQVSSPAANGAVAGNGGVVHWQKVNSVAFYRVEFSAQGDFSNPDHKYATSGNSVSLEGVAPGEYQMRVGAFSEVAGRWEYTTPYSVSVQ